MVTIMHPTPLDLLLDRAENLFINSGGEIGQRPRSKLIPFFKRVRDVDRPISFLGSNKRYGHSGARTFCLTLQVPRTCE